MIRKVDHLGIVVRSLEQSIPYYRDLLGLPFLGTEIVPDGTVRVAFFQAGESKIELIEPIANPGVEKFLEKRGEGIHHVCLQTDDIVAELARLAAAGADLIDKAPRAGAHHMQVAFVHPKSMGGVLVELAQPTDGPDAH